jgi:hypothetical protein
MDENGNLEEQVKYFVARYLLVEPGRLQPSTRIGQDMGVDGDDGAELIQAFGERFGVDLSHFRFDRHFGPEGGASSMGCLWYLLLPRSRPHLVPITISDLVEAARTGQWQTPLAPAE